MTSTSSLAGVRVLVVEDELFIALELESILTAAGCRVVGPAAGLEQAVSLVAQERPQAALLDADLAGRSTAPVAEALAAQGTPFAVVTGYATVRSDSALLRDAPRVAKPFTAAGIVQALADLLGPAASRC